MKNKKVLFIVEGDKEKEELEKTIIKYLNLNVEECNIITYHTTIYELYEDLISPINDGISLPAILIKDEKVTVDENFQLDSTLQQFI